MQEDKLDLVSIIIPCYNASAYIKEAINSVLEQTYKAIEIIVVNDGSTDNSEEIIQSFGDKVIYISQPNQGVATARNTGYSVSTGNYICFLDADDWFYPSNIESKIDYFNNHKNFGLVHSVVDVTDSHLKSTSKYYKGKEGNNLTQSLLNFELPIPCPSNALIKKSVLEQSGLFDINLSTSADFELWLRICQKFAIGMVQQMGIKYRLHENNMFSNKTLYKSDIKYIYNKHAHNSKYNWNCFLYKNNFSLMLHSVKEGDIPAIGFYFFSYLKYLFKNFINSNKP